MVISLLNAPSCAVNDVSATSNAPFHTIVSGIVVSDASCPADRE